MTDSLVFDHITEYSPVIIDFFRSYPKSTFEFKTKSDNIDLLLKTRHNGNIVVGWTFNPQYIIDRAEFYTASLRQRIKAAQKCTKAGFKIAIHFDPIIYFSGWEKHYEPLVNMLFDRIKAKNIAWISLGTLRISVRLKKVIENRFPESDLLNEEIILGYDEKLRYRYEKRRDIYKKMMTWIQKRSKKVKIYLCMEDHSMCQNCQTLPQKF
ncbi:MAG: hypothetical protein U9Q21_00495 [Candidatus Auribacterota bacterium]|nr:hypothetical protein [Candidatus Auribacterota bacterium]